MNFKPEFNFWMVVILSRKFGVAFASLMFRDNPTFQLAVILLVVFGSFTLQVRYRPFLSHGEYVTVRRELQTLADRALEDEDYLHYREVHNRVGQCYRANLDIMKREAGMGRKKAGGAFWVDAGQKLVINDERTRLQKYFFDVNSVEAILLGAIIIVSLSGIMFQSDEFDSSSGDYWMGQLVLVVVFIVVFGSLTYYVVVLIHEFSPFKFNCGRFSQYFMKLETKRVQGADVEFDDIKLVNNAYFEDRAPNLMAKSAVLERELEDLRGKVNVARRQNDELKTLKEELR